MTTGRAFVLLLLLLGAGVTLRLWALGLDGHSGDVRVLARWAERMAEVGPWQFYEGSASVYPALLYPLWLVGLAFDGDALALILKGLSIPFDVALAVLLFAVMRRQSNERRALTVSALYLLNPATLLAGPAWGQVDSAGTLPYVGALVALAAGRHATAGALAVVATMVKPQLGLVALPVAVVVLLRAWRGNDWGPIGRTLAGVIVTYALLAAPLRLDPMRYLGFVTDVADLKPLTSLNAFNPWGLVVGFSVPDHPYVGIGALLFGLGLVGALFGLRRPATLAVLLGVGAALVLAFYFLPTRVHERYLFPAVALLAPFAAFGMRELVAYIALSLAFAGTLLYALHETTAFQMPEPWASYLVSPAGVWVIGLVLMGSALVWAWLLIIRRPSFRADIGSAAR